ncbi:MAG: YkvA family protein [Mangrovibacterium sp.]
MTHPGYSKYFTEGSFKEKLQRMASVAGSKVVYAALLLYFLMKDPAVPLKAKLIITAALGYFILPADAVPDLAPLIGFSDDLGVLMFALGQISEHIRPETKIQATQQLQRWFKSLKNEDIQELDRNLL